MPSWRDLRRFLDKYGRYKRSGEDLIYIYKGRLVRVSKSSKEISPGKWRKILKHDLGITQEEFNAGL